MRWPHLGPTSIGAGIVLGYLFGLIAGPLAAVPGTMVGLFLGDLLDQRS